MFKEKQAEYDSLLVRCNEQLKGETNSDKSLANASQLESSLKTLSMRFVYHIKYTNNNKNLHHVLLHYV